MRSCDYTVVIKKKDEIGNTIVEKHKCNSRTGLREIEFKHPEYRDLRQSVLVCVTHYREVFGEWEEIRERLDRNLKNEKFRYWRDFKIAKKNAEYFDEFDYRERIYRKVDLAYERLRDHTRDVCAYELCDIKLENVKKIYRIIIYRTNGKFSHSLECCSLKHWEKFKYRIGILVLPDPKKKPVTLDTFSGVTK